MKLAASLAVLLALAAQSARADEADPTPPPNTQASKPDPAPKPKRTKVAQEQVEMEGRQIPGQQKTYPPPPSPNNPGAVWAPPPEAFPTDEIPVPDRWRLIDELEGTPIANWYDPYNQNALKADRPIEGYQDWFFNLSAISDSVIEPRSFPLPTGIQTTQRAG